MASWNDILKNIYENKKSADEIRWNSLLEISKKRERNVISYYSGFLKIPTAPDVEINDLDIHGFMSAVHGLDYTKGLDLILHTPGGRITAAEAIMDYLRVLFKNDIEVFVPQIAMSAGTMMACASRKIWMGKHSSLGPTDPHLNGLSVLGVLEEFELAKSEIMADPKAAAVWQFTLQKLPPAFLMACRNALKLTKDVLKRWLAEGMFQNGEKSPREIDELVEKLMNDNHFEHGRHIPSQKLIGYGLKIEELEKDQTLQDLVLTFHHTNMIILDSGNFHKLIDNHLGRAVIRQTNESVRMQALQKNANHNSKPLAKRNKR